MKHLWQAYGNRRMAAMLSLGFASGLPFVLVTDALQARMKAEHRPVATIGHFALVGLPYALKFLWAPLMDRYVPPVLGRRRGWLLVTQFLLTFAIAGMAAVAASAGWAVLGAAALLVAFLSASQDVVADAYRTDVLPDDERGAGAAVFVVGYRAAVLGASAAMLILVDRSAISWRGAYAAAAALMALAMVAAVLAPEPRQPAAVPRTLADAVVSPLRQFLGRPDALAVLAFIVLFKLPEVLAGAMSLPFLADVGVSGMQIGVIRQVFGIGLSIVGALAGGAVTVRLRLRPALVLFGALGALSNLGFLLVARAGPHLGLVAAVVGFESFCAGLVTAGFSAFLMSQCDVRFSAFQFALLSSLMRVTAIAAGTPSGDLQKAIGWGGFFAVSVVAGLPSLLLLPWVREADGRRGLPVAMTDETGTDGQDLSVAPT